MNNLTKDRDKLFARIQKTSGARGMRSLTNDNHDRPFGKKQAAQFRANQKAQMPLFRSNLRALVKKHAA